MTPIYELWNFSNFTVLEEAICDTLTLAPDDFLIANN
jgi:hypothetical protein